MRTKDPFENLLQRYRGLLFTLCRRYGRRGLEVEDLVQEASIALWRAREKIYEQGNALQEAALVWKISRNAVIDVLRVYHEHDELPESYDAMAEDRTLLNELHEQIETLPEPDRSIVKMQLDGYSYEEIGLSLGMSEKNVSVRLVRAKEKIKEKMRNEK
ncbi:MAG: sigma-70 family RNA polymerase sigma factor [Bacteroidales bacterium]|nr:sigma-70 family RNA polymerase sigma factor [Bacteroidales bacterium]